MLSFFFLLPLLLRFGASFIFFLFGVLCLILSFLRPSSLGQRLFFSFIYIFFRLCFPPPYATFYFCLFSSFYFSPLSLSVSSQSRFAFCFFLFSLPLFTSASSLLFFSSVHHVFVLRLTAINSAFLRNFSCLCFLHYFHTVYFFFIFPLMYYFLFSSFFLGSYCFMSHLSVLHHYSFMLYFL